MSRNDAPLRRTAALTPMLVATIAVVVAAISLTAADVATPFVVAMWLVVAVVGGATIAVARRL